MLSTKHARHAKPSLHPTRSTMSAGLTAVLLPLCMASPALADVAPSPSASPSASASAAAPTTSSAYTLPGWDDVETVSLMPRRTATAKIVLAPADDEQSPTTAPTATAPTAAATATQSAPAESAPTAEPTQAPVKQTTILRMSGPRGTVAPGAQTVAVRLLADNAPVKNGYVRLEKKTGSGWVYAGRLLTRGDGLGIGQLNFTQSTRMRAVYAGSLTRTPETSSDIVVTVRKAATFRATALSVASQQAGKPYRYGATGPSSFDCSGLVRFAFARAGKSLPRTSSSQRRATVRISKSQAVPGDLVFINAVQGHVGIYAGNGKMWDAPRSGGRVSLRRIWTSNYSIGRIN